MSVEKKVVKVTNHIYQPKHEILSKEEAEQVLKKFNVRTNQLPYIMSNDKGFIANMSILDLLFNIGPGSIDILKTGGRK